MTRGPDTALVPIEAVLANAAAYQRGLFLYAAETRPMRGSTPAAVLDPYETEDPDEVPAFAHAHGLKYVLPMSTVLEILENARQHGRVSPEDRVDALNHYYSHDAFVRF